ncbi:MAG TPA: tRNA (guanosine(37)-N1)-methyltransferase TrmD, partial [Burkholderiaceae bacterium]|nr:tRNA (guanosine(37)-N1)-methyltransferase TrmD [Burkholderiaceae bacterium]
RTVDDRPFGGGPGMVMMAEPLALAVAAAKSAQQALPLSAVGGGQVIALSPAGVPLTDARVRRWAQDGRPLVLVCGRYEGIDQRFVDACVDEEVSVGDFVLSGGELGAMVMIDAIVRQLPGTIKAASSQQESFADGLLDAPQYTRPEQWRGLSVPEVLLSGHHERIEVWRLEQKRLRTQARRPDLWQAAKK